MLDGTIKRHPDGFGFFIPEDRTHPDVYIPRQAMKGAMTNDKVRALVYPEGRGDRFRGEIDQILSRSLQKTISRFTAAAYGSGIIEDSEHAWGSNIIIPEGKTLGAKDGQLVCIKISDYGSASTVLKGEVIEVVGNESDPMLDIRRVIYSQNLPSDFSTATLEEAKHLPTEVDENDFRNRKDLRKLDFVTIDGATAKDFDDAVYVENKDNGFQVWVAIADVSHYVKPGSPIDKDAYERGNSTYFPNFVIPMLPEALSNDLCSLKPKVPRLAFVAEMSLDFAGELTKSEFYEAVIQSKARVTYGEAQEVFDGSTPESLIHVEKAIQRAGELAKILMARRFRNGSLDLEIPDSQIMLDAAGNPTDIIRADRLFAHRTIEELMLLANIAVAIYGASKGPFLYRIHEQPAQENLQMLNRFLTAFGGTRTVDGYEIQKKIGKALQQFHGKPQAEVLSMLTLRAMKQAKYAAQNVGHFGLGFSDYTHFTSPIRRYSDLIVHRALKIYLGVYDKTATVTEGSLATAGTNLSATEQRSAKAERQFKSIKRARFMLTFLGQEFDGLITSVTKFGVFVMLRTYDVDGLIRLEDLGNEPFEFDDENLILTGKRTKTMFSLGDPLRIQVAAANPDEGQVTFTLIEKLKPAFESTMPLKTKASIAVGEDSGKGERTNRDERKNNRDRQLRKPDRSAARGGNRSAESRTQESQPGRSEGSRPGRSDNTRAGRPGNQRPERGSFKPSRNETSRSGDRKQNDDQARGPREDRFAATENVRPAKLAFGKPLPPRKDKSAKRGNPKSVFSKREEFPKRNELPKRGENVKRRPDERDEEIPKRAQKTSAPEIKASPKPVASVKSEFGTRSRAAKKSRQFEKNGPNSKAEVVKPKRSLSDAGKKLFGKKSVTPSSQKEESTRGNSDNKSANRADTKKRR